MDEEFSSQDSTNASETFTFAETTVSASNLNIPSGIFTNNVNNISGRLPSPQTPSGGNFGGFNLPAVSSCPLFPVPTSGGGPAPPPLIPNHPTQLVEDYKPDSVESAPGFALGPLPSQVSSSLRQPVEAFTPNLPVPAPCEELSSAPDPSQVPISIPFGVAVATSNTNWTFRGNVTALAPLIAQLEARGFTCGDLGRRGDGFSRDFELCASPGSVGSLLLCFNKGEASASLNVAPRPVASRSEPSVSVASMGDLPLRAVVPVRPFSPMDPPLQESPLPSGLDQRLLPERKVKVETRKFADLSGLSSSRSPPPYDRNAKRKRDVGRHSRPLLASPDQSGAGSPFLARARATHPRLWASASATTWEELGITRGGKPDPGLSSRSLYTWERPWSVLFPVEGQGPIVEHNMSVSSAWTDSIAPSTSGRFQHQLQTSPPLGS